MLLGGAAAQVPLGGATHALVQSDARNVPKLLSRAPDRRSAVGAQERNAEPRGGRVQSAAGRPRQQLPHVARGVERPIRDMQPGWRGADLACDRAQKRLLAEPPVVGDVVGPAYRFGLVECERQALDDVADIDMWKGVLTGADDGRPAGA